ncbi:MAG: hypothetical protein FJ095_11345 [Deltaproteobacteria bacterium]|nr:hypothetical protein [Deltaproteobacteria bacterium]
MATSRSVGWSGFVSASLASLFDASCGDSEGRREPPPPPRDVGQIATPDGDCMPAGVQGCAELFMGDERLCHPSSDRC